MFNMMNLIAANNTYIAIGIAAAVVLVLVIVGVVAGSMKKKKAKKTEAPVMEETPKAEEKKADKKADKKVEKKVEKPVEEKPIEKEQIVEEEPVVVVEPIKKAKKVEEVKEVVEEKPVKEEPVKEEKVEEVPVVEEAVKEEPAKEEPALVKEEEVKVEETPAPVKEEEAPVVEQPVKEEAPVKKETPAKKSTTKKAVGKWQVKQKSDDEYVAYLYANNGSTMLTSETYASLKGCLGGIETIKKNVADGNFEIYRDKKGNYYYKLKSKGNRLLCVGEIYSNKAACESAVESVYNFAINSKLIDDVDVDKTIITWTPDGEVEASKMPGKWTIEELDGLYQACLYASNGALLVSGELYTSVLSAKNSLDNIKKNALEYRFIIDRDKSGNYYFKLRNAQKSVLCVGETYPTQANCESAIESVIRFCKNAELVEA